MLWRRGILTAMYILRIKNDQMPFYFPLTTADTPRMPVVKPHAHDCTEIGIILRGRATHVCEGDVRELQAGDVIVIYPGQSHAFPETDKLHIFNVLFLPDELNLPSYDLKNLVGYNDLLHVADAGQQPHSFLNFRLTPEDFAQVRKIVSIMNKEKSDIGRSGYRSAMVGLFMSLLCHLLRSYSAGLLAAGSSNNSEPRTIDNAIKYLNVNYLKEFDLNALLKLSAMSRSSFMEHFRRITGCSPKQYVINKRIAYAAHLIANKRQSLTATAMECGFYDSSHFCKTFSRVIGESPRAYLQRLRERGDKETSWSKRERENSFLNQQLDE